MALDGRLVGFFFFLAGFFFLRRLEFLVLVDIFVRFALLLEANRRLGLTWLGIIVSPRNQRQECHD